MTDLKRKLQEAEDEINRLVTIHAQNTLRHDITIKNMNLAIASLTEKLEASEDEVLRLVSLSARNEYSNKLAMKSMNDAITDLQSRLQTAEGVLESSNSNVVSREDVLSGYFDLVADVNDWKNPIDAIITVPPKMGTSEFINMVYDAITYYTTWESKDIYIKHLDGNKFNVKCAGYRASDAGT